MRVSQLFVVAALCCASWARVFAGSYPLGAATVTQGFQQPDRTIDLADDSAIGSDQNTADGSPVAGVYGGVLRLADKGTTNAIGSFKLPDLDQGNAAKSFDLKFSVTMNALPGSPGGEGWSVNFGHIPLDNGTGEGGFAPLPRGLTIAFDTKTDPEDPSSIEVFVGGVSVGNFAYDFLMDGLPKPVTIHWDATGLDLSFDSRSVLADLPTPGFSPGVGDTFGFSARTTDSTMDLFIDNLKATTQALLPLDTGGPIISEFVANNSEVEDEFAEKPGWIEVFNGSPNSADLTGWYMTDSKKNLTKWKISGFTLTPYNYQIVFASGKDRPLTPTSFLHANFSLAKSGGFVALVRPDGTIASSYEYGQQDKDVSFGEQGVQRKTGFMYPASPGAVNTSLPAPASFSPEVQFSHPGGFITQPVTLALSVPATPGIEIRYTLDRTEPGTNSPIYSTPLVVSKVTMVRARSYAPDHLPGRVSSRTFVTIDETLSNYAGTGKIFDSNLPLIYVDSFGVSVDSSTGGLRPYRPCYSLIIPSDPATGRASLTNTPDYAGPSGTHVRGESSATFDQRSYALELWDENGNDQGASLLGMPADSDWILYGPWSEKALMRNKLIFDWMIALRGEDGTAVRTRFVEVLFNQSKATTSVGYNTYKGVYVLMEKMKRGKDRVPLQSLNQYTVDPALITGGYIIRHDKDDALKNNWSTPSGISLQSFDPDRLNATQLSYMKSFLGNFEKTLNGPNFKDFYKGYRAYIDPDTFIDAQWMLEFSKQVDGYVFSTYWFKDRGGRLRAGPIWDFNIALGNANYAGGDSPIGWYQGSASGGLWYPKLHSDIEYKLAHWDRYWHMRRTIWDTNAIMSKIDENMRVLLDGYTGFVSNRAPATVQNPVARHFRKWPYLGRYDWPNPNKELSIKYWQGEIDYMKGFIMSRIAWLDDQSMLSNKVALLPPIFSHNGGPISQPVQIEIAPYNRSGAAVTFPGGDIYYTLDNSDPRLPGGAVSDKATRYSGPIPVTSSLTVNARLLAQQWSPLATATYLLDAVPARASNLVVSEIMYAPALLTPFETNAALANPQGFEFLELRNIGNKPVDLTGLEFTQGITFDFNHVPAGSRLLQPGESGVLVSDQHAFMVRNPNVEPRKILGTFRGHLDSGGETISLQGADGSTIKQFKYDTSSPWPVAANPGQSIVLNNPATNPKAEDPSAWMLSAKAGGTPGESGLGADTFSGDASQDSDGDGVPDLFEFFSGSDPENPGSAALPSAAIAHLEVNGATDDYLTFRFNRRPNAQGLQLTIEQSTNLSSWAADAGTVILTTTQTNRDGTLTDFYRGTAPARKGPGTSFYRLKVQQQ